jgi:hypothetical protein
MYYRSDLNEVYVLYSVFQSDNIDGDLGKIHRHSKWVICIKYEEISSSNNNNNHHETDGTTI